MVASDTKGLLYSDIIDEHFIALTKRGIDLTQYLQSNVAFHKVDHKDFPIDDINSKTLMIPCEKENLNVILSSYEEVIGKHFNADSGQSNPNAGGAEDADNSNLDSPLL